MRESEDTASRNIAPLIAVTGASGELGRRIARRLAARGAFQRLIVRDLARAPQLAGAPHEIRVAPGYDDRVRMTEALRGAATVLLVSARETPNRLAEHKNAVNAVVDAGVRRIVYTSFLGASPNATFTLAREHYETEQYILQTGVAFTFLRNNLYMDLVPFMASSQGQIAGPAGNGRFACVSRDDVADVAVSVLLHGGHDGRTYDVTGGEAQTLAYAAEQLQKYSGRPVVYKNETLDEAYASRSSYNVPHSEVEGWVTSYLAIANGELEIVSDTVPKLTGHAAQNFPEFLRTHPESYAHLIG
jgi:NAD(P)H dehydrogenase (quinone)